MQQFTQAIGAGQTWRMQVGGEYFRLLHCPDPVNVRFYRQGAEVASAQQMDTGFYLRPAGRFEAFEITSDTAQTVRVMVLDGDGGYDRFNVDITSALQDIAVNVTGDAEVVVKQAVTINDQAAVAVGVAATQLLPALATRRGVRFTNAGSVEVFIGGAGVTVAAGAIKLSPGATWVDNEAAPAAWYGISGTAGQNIKIQELI